MNRIIASRPRTSEQQKVLSVVARRLGVLNGAPSTPDAAVDRGITGTGDADPRCASRRWAARPGLSDGASHVAPVTDPGDLTGGQRRMAMRGVIGVPAGGSGPVDDVGFRVDVRGWAPRTRVESAGMKANRSIPASTVIPVLIYPVSARPWPGCRRRSASSSGCGSAKGAAKVSPIPAMSGS